MITRWLRKRAANALIHAYFEELNDDDVLIKTYDDLTVEAFLFRQAGHETHGRFLLKNRPFPK